MKIFKKIREFKCNILDWHNPKNPIHFDGVNWKTKCRYCGREILQDSQGNWFRLKED